MSRRGLRVGVIGCGLIGAKRARALGSRDELIGCHDASAATAAEFAATHGTHPCTTVSELLQLAPEVVLVAVTHDALAALAEQVLAVGAHVLVEKPAGLGVAQIERLLAAEARSGRRVKVGFNHRFHPGVRRAVDEVHSGAHGELLHLRAHYGHGGRPGYDREWRTQPERSGGGELVDQGMHLLDLTNWIAGSLPLHSALLRTHFWQTQVEDNAALILGDADSLTDPWALLHVSWTEWKNCFSLEIYCRTAKLHVNGLVRSYGPQRLRIYRMRPELGPPDEEEIWFPDEDVSWVTEWEHFANAITDGDRSPLLGDLRAARDAWAQIEAAYRTTSYNTAAYA